MLSVFEITCLRSQDRTCEAGCSVAVVDIDDTYASGAAVEHSEQGSQAPEAGPVTDAGGDGDDGAVHQPGYHTGQRPLHTLSLIHI